MRKEVTSNASPEESKYRRQQRGRMKGKALRGNTVTHGEFGLQALEPAWISSAQIEAARIAMTRTLNVAARYGSRFSPTSLTPASRLRPEWVLVKAPPITG